MSTKRKGHRKIIEEFIRVYQSEPCLWRTKSKEYFDKGKKDIAYTKLVLKYRELDPIADRQTVVRKINSMRTTYRKQNKKIEESQRLGRGVPKIPTLWYAHLLDFLKDQDNVSCQSSSSEEVLKTAHTVVDCDRSYNDDLYDNDDDSNDSEALIDLKEEEMDDVKSGEEIETQFVSINDAHNNKRFVDNTEDISHTPQPKKHKLEMENDGAESSQPVLKQTLDEFQMFANHVAEQLRLLPLDKALCIQVEIQKMVAKHRIAHYKGGVSELANKKYK